MSVVFNTRSSSLHILYTLSFSVQTRYEYLYIGCKNTLLLFKFSVILTPCEYKVDYQSGTLLLCNEPLATALICLILYSEHIFFYKIDTRIVISNLVPRPRVSCLVIDLRCMKRLHKHKKWKYWKDSR